MRKGDLELHMVSDGLVWVDPGGPFGLVPRALYASIATPNQKNLIPQSLNCLLVRSDDKLVLIDTGLGPKLSEKVAARWGLERPTGGLVDGMHSLGFEPEQVDIVINTHLHWDHCGGNTVGAGRQLRPVFPNAEYVVQRMEWADASFPDERTRGTYFEENFGPMIASGQMRLLHGDVEITPHIRCVMTPGHTRGHQSVVISDEDWRGLFVSDMATFAIHMRKTGWVTAFDVEPLENIRTKRVWQRWAVERQAWLFFIHDTGNPVIRLIEREGNLELKPIAEAQPLIEPLPTPQLLS